MTRTPDLTEPVDHELSDHVETVVIGAGPAGLATAAQLQRHGISVTVFESGPSIAQRWADRYDGLHLNSARWLSDLPGRRMDRSAGRYPSRDEWVDYLTAYAAEQDLDIRRSATVENLSRCDGHWHVTTGGSVTVAEDVVVATGHDQEPVMPQWHGLEGFDGTVMHSSQFRSADEFTGAKVLVVGTGNSGCEIATLVSEQAEKVWLSRRTAPLIVPESFLGVSITAWGLLGAVAPDGLLDRTGEAIHWLRFRDLCDRGFGRPGKRLSRMRHTYYSPPVDRGIADAVRSGSVAVVNAVQRLHDGDVELAGGTRVQPDVVIAATGYRPGLEPLLGDFDVLDTEGEPVMNEHCAAAAEPSLHFVGFRFGLLALLPYIEVDARKVAVHIARRRSRTG